MKKPSGKKKTVKKPSGKRKLKKLRGKRGNVASRAGKGRQRMSGYESDKWKSEEGHRNGEILVATLREIQRRYCGAPLPWRPVESRVRRRRRLGRRPTTQSQVTRDKAAAVCDDSDSVDGDAGGRSGTEDAEGASSSATCREPRSRHRGRGVGQRAAAGPGHPGASQRRGGGSGEVLAGAQSGR